MPCARFFIFSFRALVGERMCIAFERLFFFSLAKLELGFDMFQADIFEYQRSFDPIPIRKLVNVLIHIRFGARLTVKDLINHLRNVATDH